MLLAAEKRTATTILVAASNAPGYVKRAARFVCDGVDDHVQLQAALTEIEAAGGGLLQLSRGAFKGAGKLTCNTTGLRICGESMQSTQFQWDNADFLEIGAANTQLSTCTLSDFTMFESGGSSTTAVGIEFLSAITTSLVIERVRASGFGGGEFIINGTSGLKFRDNYLSHNRAGSTGNALKIVANSGASWGVVAIKVEGNYFASTVSGANPMVYIEDVATGRFIGNNYEGVPSGVVGLHIEATSGHTAQECVFVGEHFEQISGTAWTMKDVTDVVNICSRGAEPAMTWDAVTANSRYVTNIGAFQLSDIETERLLLGLTGPNDILSDAALQIGPIRGQTHPRVLMVKGDSSTGAAAVVFSYAKDTGGTSRQIVNWGSRVVTSDSALPASEFYVEAVTTAGGSLGAVFRAGANGVLLGNGSSTFKKLLHGVATWDPGSLNDGASATTTVTVTGATVSSSMVFCSMNNISTGGWQLTGIVTAANTVTVTLTNHTGGTVDLGAGAVRAAVMLV